MHQLARNYWLIDRLVDSMALHEKVLELFKSTNGRDHESTHWAMVSYARVCQQAGDLDHAERLLREALEISRKRDGTNDERLTTANTLGWLARTLLLQKRYATAEPLVREAVAIFEKEEPYHPRRFYWVSLLGDVLFSRQKYAEAEPLLLQGYEDMKQMEAFLSANDKRRLAETGERVVHFYEVINQPEKARVWREKVNAKLPEAASAGVK